MIRYFMSKCSIVIEDKSRRKEICGKKLICSNIMENILVLRGFAQFNAVKFTKQIQSLN